MNQMKTQQDSLLEMLKVCGTFTQSTSEDVYENMKKAFNQIVHHLSRLTRLWHKVLPGNIFQKAISKLHNTVLEHVINTTLKMEDISADEANHLHTVFNVLIERTPEITQICHPAVELTSHLWKKFLLITQVLNGDLQEIVALWTEPANREHLDASEVRNLVRALFQNTERRSQALAKIKAN
jgi:centromere/kinetochore protein ZW10